MKNSTKNTAGSIAIFLTVCAGLIVVFYNYAPEPATLQLDKYKKVEPTEPEHVPTWYKFSDGSWSTLSRHPKTGERGEQITEKQLETLKLAE